jgi:uncharacterized protein (TIGR03643 family)
MAISKEKIIKWQKLSDLDKDRIVRMAWEDRTAFDAIKEQFGLTANEVVHFMRTQLDKNAYRRWRRRATEQGQLKHAETRGSKVLRFKSSRQRIDGSTKGWK